MIKERPSISPNARLSLVEVCSLLGVSRETVRKWRNTGILPFRVRMVNNKKYYEGRDVLRLWDKVS